MSLKNIGLLIASVFLSQLAGFMGSYFTINSIETWYKMLNKPFFNPPNWIFGPVWIILYTLMGISFFLVLRSKPKDKKPVYVFLFHLVINSLWSIVFFGMQNPEAAVVVILTLWFLIVYLILVFGKINKTASILLVPYILWVSFASILNIAIAYLN